MRVLLADDDALMRMLHEEVLRASGHDPVVASDGTAAWQIFEHEAPPMVILDWQMPGLDGLTVCRRIREHPQGDTTFVLVVTARDGAEDLTSVLDAGADDYLSKPVTPDNLQARLRIAERRIEVSLARKAAEEELQRARYLAGIGETTLTVQHEINNPLAALLTNLGLIQAGALNDEETKEAIAVIDEQARRIADVVKQLRKIEKEGRAMSVEYMGKQRMIDLRGDGGPTAQGRPR